MLQPIVTLSEGNFLSDECFGIGGEPERLQKAHDSEYFLIFGNASPASRTRVCEGVALRGKPSSFRMKP